MSIRSFYLKRYFDKRQSKISLIFLVVFSLIYVTYFAIATKDAWFFKIIFLLLGLYDLVDVLYLLKKELYHKKGVR